MLNIAIEHGMDAREVGRYRVEDARRTDGVVARTGVVAGTTTGVVAGTPGMDATWSNDTGWKMRALPMGKVRPGCELTWEG